MEITQPEIQSAVEQLESLKNQATLFEAEVLRLQKLVVSSKYTIEEQEKSKLELAAQIEKLQKTYEQLLDKVASKTAELTEIALKLDQKEAFLRELEPKIAELVEEKQSLQNSIEEEQSALDVQLSQFSTEKSQFYTEKEAFEKRKAQLKEVLDTI